jgi:hypothetical protein
MTCPAVNVRAAVRRVAVGRALGGLNHHPHLLKRAGQIGTRVGEQQAHGRKEAA